MKQTLKSKALDYVEKKGKAKWAEIHKFMLDEKNLPNTSEFRGLYSSYFSGLSDYISKINGGVKKNDICNRTAYSHGLLMRPTKKDGRYLVKSGDYYVVKFKECK